MENSVNIDPFNTIFKSKVSETIVTPDFKSSYTPTQTEQLE